MSITRSILKVGDGYSEALSSIGNLGKAAGKYTNKLQNVFKSEKKGSSSKIRALYTNGFFAQDEIFIPKFFVRAFDEPTYLTFRLEFITDPSETAKRNLAFNNAGVTENTQSVLYSTMYDNMPEPFLEDYGILGIGDSSFGRTYSSEAYLDLNLGDHGRAAMLHNFKAALKDIEENFPFYFKSISGLSSLTMVNPTYGARLKDAELKIDCEEGLDLKITQLLNMYRKIVWDDTYQRWVLPDMMRYFGMRIYISEIRLFHDRRKESSWEDVNVNIFGNNGKGKTYDFSDGAVRNAYSLPTDKSKWWEIANNALTTGTAVSNAFLGTRSNISKALNYASATVTAGMDALSGIDDIFNDVMMCNNAINAVMPTICFECHMCEFDISKTMEYMDSQYNNTHDSKKVSPSIRIKVGQVKEKQSYPLNKFLSQIDGEKYGHKKPDGLNINSLKDVNNLRDDQMGYVGQFVDDEVLNKRYQKPNLKDRIYEYNENLEHSIGDDEALHITRKRLGPKIIDNLDEMNYSTEGSSQMAAAASLTASLMNEATDIARRNEGDSDWFGTNSLALDQEDYIINGMTAIGKTFKADVDEIYKGTYSRALNQEDSIIDGIKAVGEALKDAADKIYDGAELKSLALSDVMRAQIADKMFDDYIRSLEETAEEGSNLEKVLKSYRMAQMEDMPRSTATSKNEISGFGFING